MPRYGFSGNEPDMRKLILYILSAVGEPVRETELTALALLDDNADYFVYADALSGLLAGNLLTRENGLLRGTSRGDEIVSVTERELPAALRRAVAKECAAVRDRQLRERCVTAETVTSGGTAYFSGVLTDGVSPLLELKLQTGGEKQALALRKRFERDAETIMQKIWEVMTES